jgi:gliding motility-associated-like protein
LKSALIILFAVCLATLAKAQGEKDLWYFGNYCGLSFRTSPPTPLYDGELANDYYWGSPSEGCATQSDQRGNLLFYTDGIRVWNRNHQVMPNGSALAGHWSSTQSALIVAKPGTTGEYFIFTTDENTWIDPPNEGLRYSQVNMGLAGGLGDVVPGTKNTLLLKPATEKLAGVKHSNNQDTWVIAHGVNSDLFYAYLVTAAGVSHAPVISKAGSVHTASLGYLKSSGDGTRLALALHQQNAFELLDFDPCTGVVSRPVTLASGQFEAAYGVEFSPDNTKLYGTTELYGNNQQYAGLFQFDLLAGNAEQIVASVVRVAVEPYGITLGALQMGKDGRMYVARRLTGYLGVIEQPNRKGLACKYDNEGVYFDRGLKENREVSTSLPNFVNDSSKPGCSCRFGAFTLGKDTTLCAGSVLTLQPSFAGDSPRWQDGTAGAAYQVEKSGLYWVETKVEDCIFRDSIQVTFITPPGVALGADLVLCEVQTKLLSVPAAAGTSYRWQDGSTGTSYLVKAAGSYWVEARTGPCLRTDTVTVTYTSPPVVSLGRDTTLCSGSTLQLRLPFPGAAVKWSTGETGNAITISTPGTYWAQVSEGLCNRSDTVQVNYQDCITFIPNVITPNGDAQNDYFRVLGLDLESWRLVIVNRWGKVVYTTDRYRNEWQGEGVASGLYYYRLFHASRDISYTGWVHVLR